MNDSYSIDPDVTRGQLKNAGFIQLAHIFKLKKWLVKGYVSIIIVIYKDDLTVVQNIMNEQLHIPYEPFYSELFKKNNDLVDKIIIKRQVIINDLENRGIIIRENTKIGQ